MTSPEPVLDLEAVERQQSLILWRTGIGLALLVAALVLFQPPERAIVVIVVVVLPPLIYSLRRYRALADEKAALLERPDAPSTEATPGP